MGENKKNKLHAFHDRTAHTHRDTGAGSGGAGGGPGCAPPRTPPARSPPLCSTNPRQRDVKTTSKLAISIKK